MCAHTCTVSTSAAAWFGAGGSYYGYYCLHPPPMHKCSITSHSMEIPLSPLLYVCVCACAHTCSQDESGVCTAAVPLTTLGYANCTSTWQTGGACNELPTTNAGPTTQAQDTTLANGLADNVGTPGLVTAYFQSVQTGCTERHYAQVH